MPLLILWGQSNSYLPKFSFLSFASRLQLCSHMKAPDPDVSESIRTQPDDGLPSACAIWFPVFPVFFWFSLRLCRSSFWLPFQCAISICTLLWRFNFNMLRALMWSLHLLLSFVFVMCDGVIELVRVLVKTVYHDYRAENKVIWKRGRSHVDADINTVAWRKMAFPRVFWYCDGIILYVQKITQKRAATHPDISLRPCCQTHTTGTGSHLTQRSHVL